MKKVLIPWILAFIIAIEPVIYQRVTGPQHPINSIYNIQQTEKEIDIKFARFHDEPSNHEITIKVFGYQITKHLYYRTTKQLIIERMFTLNLKGIFKSMSFLSF